MSVCVCVAISSVIIKPNFVNKSFVFCEILIYTIDIYGCHFTLFHIAWSLVLKFPKGSLLAGAIYQS